VGVLDDESDAAEWGLAIMQLAIPELKGPIGLGATELMGNVLIEAATVSANESSQARSAAESDKSARAERVALACCAVTDANTTSALPADICAECGIIGGVENAVARSRARLRTLIRPISWK
jgi:hypothetical protein